jgi:glycosyltransferase involved in cell wall biosynthesis
LKIGSEYHKLRLLVKAHGTPLGWLWLSDKKSHSISTEQITELIRQHFGWEIVKRYLSSDADDAKTPELAISVIVCTRNRTAFLAKCLESLQKLEYSNYEIIIVDNAPSDHSTQKLVEDFDVRYVREDIPGLDCARNRGIREARYDIVAFTDDDATPDRLWLQHINRNFQDTNIACVTGFVAPAELETKAQEIFELGYGGMGHGFHRRIFDKKLLTKRAQLWASSFGIGANMAFRKNLFERIGYFDLALDVGTPSCGAGDVEMFHRIVNEGYVIAYDPSVLIWHTHRRDMRGLRKQIKYNGRSFGCYLISCVANKSVKWHTALRFFIVHWLWKWNLKNLFGRQPAFPRSLALAELIGMIGSPWAYRATQRWKKQMHHPSKTVRVVFNQLSNVS